MDGAHQQEDLRESLTDTHAITGPDDEVTHPSGGADTFSSIPITHEVESYMNQVPVAPTASPEFYPPTSSYANAPQPEFPPLPQSSKTSFADPSNGGGGDRRPSLGGDDAAADSSLLRYEANAIDWIRASTGWSENDNELSPYSDYKSLSRDRKYEFMVRVFQWALALVCFSVTASVNFNGWDKAYKQASYDFLIATGVLIWLWTMALVILFQYHDRVVSMLPPVIVPHLLRIELVADFVFAVFTMSGSIASAVSINKSLCNEDSKQCHTVADLCHMNEKWGSDLAPGHCPVNKLATSSAFMFFLFFSFCVTFTLTAKTLVTARRKARSNYGQSL